jgi:recombination protein RecA
MKDVELFKLGENDSVDIGDDGDGEDLSEEG